ncbi:MAG: type II secretion system protein [Phycisphaerales bacterium]
MAYQKKRGFTLVELAAVIGATTLITSAVMPAAKRARQQNRGLGSASNLMQIGQGAGMYGVDNADRIPNYSVGRDLGGLVFDYDIGGGAEARVRDDITGAAAQNAEILRRRTGRYDGEFEIRFYAGRLWNRRYTNLIIMDYLDRPFPDPMFIDPADANQLSWAADPLNFGPGSGVPYAAFFPDWDNIPPGYDGDGNWLRAQVRNRWAFAPSYAVTSHAWQPDGFSGEASFHPVATTPHLLGDNDPSTDITSTIDTSSGRRFVEVRFPSAKVYYFEEHDREQAGSPYFAYDHARPDKLMFDGSVNNWASGDANASVNADEIRDKVPWVQTYLPLDTFPIPLGGLGDDTLLSQRYRWTFLGLKGVDYPMPIMGSNAGRSGR